MGLREEVLSYLEVEGGSKSKKEIEENTGDYNKDLDDSLIKLKYEGKIEETEEGYKRVQ
jgi:hypothetical protein